MPNSCIYEMKIRGSHENCNMWLNRMTLYNEQDHFYRIFDVQILEEGGTELDYYMILAGDCAWSLDTCCRANGYSNGFDLFALNTRGLSLKMEAYSSEPGIGFQEHYIYEYGECLEDECRDMREWFWDKYEYPDFKDFKAEEDLPDGIEESDFEEGCYIQGGFPEWRYEI